MSPTGILLAGFLLVILGAFIASAIISAAPAIAGVITVLFALWLVRNWHEHPPDDEGDDNKKPPE